MWKVIAGFAAFAALALFILSQGGDIDLGGEKHDIAAHSETVAEPASAASR
ncbi:hypothetical protein OOZ63_15625 [Paucibacter sp. PLA-PC-4]|uniref:hypothetical protein n=1 Tax=Paucibacter sp. PLA-PC-4 TaxID=2993655 RepID=UPI002249893A|nr:hypothetical protein [Paucibacter sp. PLA-PC-4]MCX2863262.1 hypothetical protein [Paucibacter sp. PLA-PC-4]